MKRAEKEMSMGKRVQMRLLFIFIFGFLTACSFADETTDATPPLKTKNVTEENITVMDQEQLEKLPEVFKQIHEKGKLKIALYSEDRFPYFFVNEEGELVGSDVDMAYDIAHQLGVREVEFDRSAKTYDEIIDKVVDNEVDMGISKISVTSNRAQRVLFSDPYILLKQAVLINRMQLSQKRINQTADLDPVEFLKTDEVDVGVVAGTSYIEFAREVFQSAKIIPFHTKDEMLQAVQKGEILAAFYDEFEFKRYVYEHPDALLDLQLNVMDGRNDFLAIAVSIENNLLQEWLKHYLGYREALDADQILLRYSSQNGEADE